MISFWYTIYLNPLHFKFQFEQNRWKLKTLKNCINHLFDLQWDDKAMRHKKSIQCELMCTFIDVKRKKIGFIHIQRPEAVTVTIFDLMAKEMWTQSHQITFSFSIICSSKERMDNGFCDNRPQSFCFAHPLNKNDCQFFFSLFSKHSSAEMVIIIIIIICDLRYIYRVIHIQWPSRNRGVLWIKTNNFCSATFGKSNKFFFRTNPQIICYKFFKSHRKEAVRLDSRTSSLRLGHSIWITLYIVSDC